MNSLKQAVDQMVPSDPDQRDQFFRAASHVTGSAVKEESDINNASKDPKSPEEQEKLRKTQALSPKGI